MLEADVQAKILSLHFNEIKVLDSNDFQHLTKLKELNLHDNKLTRIDPRLFKNSLCAVLLFNNNFKSNIISYFNKALFSDEKTVKEYSDLLEKQNLTYLDNWNEFIKQFEQFGILFIINF